LKFVERKLFGVSLNDIKRRITQTGPFYNVAKRVIPESVTQAAACFDRAEPGLYGDVKGEVLKGINQAIDGFEMPDHEIVGCGTEDVVRAQNPAMGAQPPVGFEHLVQQFYVSAMIQMGAGAQEGQRPRVDILGARTTIDLLGVLAEKTRGNLTEAESNTLQTVLFEVRMAFLELTSMISLQAMQPPQPPQPGKR